MTTIFSTLLLSFMIILAALLLMGIGWFISGKIQIRAGACGMNPHEKKGKDCGKPSKHCDLCSPKKEIK